MGDYRAVLVDITGLQQLVRDALEPFFGVATVVMNYDDIVQAVMESVFYDAYMARSTTEYLRDLGVPPERAFEIAVHLEQSFEKHVEKTVGRRHADAYIRYDMLGRFSIMVQSLTRSRAPTLSDFYPRLPSSL